MGKLTCETYPVILGHEPCISSELVDTADWISLEGAKGVLITVMEHYHVAANDLVLTVHQGTTGSGTTALAAGQEFQIWSNLACETSDVMVRRTDAVTYTLTPSAGAGGNGMVQFYVDASLLTNGYKWVQLGASIGDAGNFVTVLYQIEGGRYQQATPPTYVA